MALIAGLITKLIGDIFKPAAELIDELHTSDEEKLQAKEKLMIIQSMAASKAMDYESKVLDSQAKIVLAEAKGQSWLQRNWRPILMMTVIVILANNYILVPYLAMWTTKITVLTLPPKLYTLMEIGVGGYVVGRSAEKIVPKAIEAYKSKEKV